MKLLQKDIPKYVQEELEIFKSLSKIGMKIIK